MNFVAAEGAVRVRKWPPARLDRVKRGVCGFTTTQVAITATGIVALSSSRLFVGL